MNQPTIGGSDVGTLCESCEHDLDAHVFSSKDPRLGGEMWCPVQDCVCINSWSPGPMTPEQLEKLDNLFLPGPPPMPNGDEK